MQKKSNQIIGWFNWMDVLWLQKRNRTQKVPLPVHTKPFPSTRGDNRWSGRRRMRRRRRRRMLKRKLEFFSSDASGADVWGWETGHKWWGHKCSKGDAVLEWPHCHCPSFFPHNHNDQNRDHYDHNVLILMITHNHTHLPIDALSRAATASDPGGLGYRSLSSSSSYSSSSSQSPLPGTSDNIATASASPRASAAGDSARHTPGAPDLLQRNSPRKVFYPQGPESDPDPQAAPSILDIFPQDLLTSR